MRRNLSLDNDDVYCHKRKYSSDDVEFFSKPVMKGHHIVRKHDAISKLIKTGSWCYCVLCFLVIIEFAVLNSELVEVPRNAFVEASETLDASEMTCKSDYQMRLKWVVHKNYKSRNNVLYNGYTLHPDANSYCTVLTDDHGRCSLRLSSTTDAAQTYICVEPGSLEEASADLIWITKGGPDCINNSTKDLVNLTCNIEFRGNWVPTMEWIEQSSHGVKVLSVGVNTITVPNQRVTSTLVMEMTKRSRNYTCTTKFDISGKPPHTTATNVPDYIKVWTTSVLSNTQDETVRINPPNEMEASKFIVMLIPTFFIIVILTTTIVIVFIRLKNRTTDQTRLHEVMLAKNSLVQECATSTQAPDSCKIKPVESLTLIHIKEA